MSDEKIGKAALVLAIIVRMDKVNHMPVPVSKGGAEMSKILMGNDARCPCECESPCVLNDDLDRAEHRIKQLEAALERIRDCDWVITLPDRMDAVRQIAREALE